MSDLYPKIEAHETGMLDVGDGHSVYYEVSGHPQGKPAVYLHGGPGSGTNPDGRRYFDPERYRIVLFDQRGCGKSTPHSRLENNTTQDLVADIERLREHLGVERWQVFGGSWGSTLALAYAIAHRDQVTELVLRGIFTFRRREVDWLFREGGASRLYPDAWEAFVAPPSDDERRDTVASFYARMTSPDEAVRTEATRAWAQYELGMVTLLPQKDGDAARMDDEHADAIARLEAHYMVNDGFLEHEDELLEGAAELTQIPTTIVHGRYDVVCTLENAWELRKRMPWSDFVIVDDAGHSSSEPGIIRALVAATDRYAG